MLEKLIEHKKTILLTGETGSGKTSWVYRNFKNKKLFHINICEIEDNLFISHLFGHRKGAFTGAQSDYEGIVSKASGGVLFLDEIGDISLESQKKLLMFLERKIYYSLGSNQQKKFTGQIILATNKNLRLLVDKGDFREDLYYRIKTFGIKLEPLRVREDKCNYIKIEIQRNLDATRELREVHTEVYEKLFSYDWPGNYRELKNTIEFMIFNSRKFISMESLPEQMLKTPLLQQSEIFQEAKAEFETKFLQSFLIKYNYKINRTANAIGMSKVTLLKKIKQYQLVKNDI